ncbi:uncharacterized protein LOC126983056 [Eriocheir sinensis]|uniref:uncharacterized protein LOC126983056 n=1 Tax=Eriocheir sinensis TaxID=95602 RepID=UPI0021C5E05F|nr:uncharacterized protein LOC126983056 [Eriocheir sinensis]
MSEECVVCGEAEEGKPLYKKLGSGEFNVEVITALKALQMLTIPEAAKNSSYICWDCDEIVLEQYDRYLKEQKQTPVPQKQTKKQPKKKKKRDRDKLKLTISKSTQRQSSSWGIDKPQKQTRSSSSSKNNPSKAAKFVVSHSYSSSSSLSKTKQLEQQRALNAHHFSHCLMCDCSFENERRTYQRFSLKNRVNDEVDIAQVMEVLGLARHIAPDIKSRRYVCNPCFVIIRRSYKDKLMKETTEEVKAPPQPSAPALACPQASIRRATTEEHAAEIAKLLPPGLAECYKIITQNPPNKKTEAPPVTPQRESIDENSHEAEVEEEPSLDEEEEGEEEALIVSQDEHGNYLIDINERRAKKGSKAKGEDKEKPAVPQLRQRKKNVLLPKRMHKHLSVGLNDTPGLSKTASGEAEDMEVDAEGRASPPDSTNLSRGAQSQMCNICGITINHKPSSWWHTLSSPLASFENVTVASALKLLETCLASTSSSDVKEDPSVCLPCYTKVSTGFRSQVVQKIARQRNIDVSEVNLSCVKLRVLPKEALEAVEAPSAVKGATETTKVPERPPEALPTALSPDEAGEGEKENVDIERLVHKRKKEESYSPEKRRKSHRREVLDSPGTDGGQEGAAAVTPCQGSRSHCPRGKDGRFMKNAKQKQQQPTPQARTPAAHASQKTADTPTTSTQELTPRGNKEPKEIEPLVILKDLKFVLPQEAFSGKAVSSHKIESIMEPPSRLDQSSLAHAVLDTNASPLQLVFSALSIYHPPDDVDAEPPPTTTTPSPPLAAASPSMELPGVPKVCGRCVVCGCSFTVSAKAWYGVEDNVRPPTLLVPVRWVCVSLAVCLPQVSEDDARQGKVCQQCFKLLGDQFELFVKRKVGESCGLETQAVDLSKYSFTFNPTTMNLEAEPKQQSYLHEFEDVGQLLQRIQPLVEQFSLDEVVSEGERQPVLEQHFCVWLLLVLNELRMQVGAAIRDLARWLLALMPADMYESGLRPCPNNLASFLLNITSCFRNLTQDMLEGPIPAWVFVTENTFQASEAGKAGTALSSKGDDKDLCWEDFLQHVKLDALMGGRAQPVAAEHFTQGLVYAVWRTTQLLGEGEQQLMDWLRQLSPLPMSKEQLENLLAMIGTLHNHLEEHPEDIHELQQEAITRQQSPALGVSGPEKTPHTSPAPRTNGGCKAVKHKSITPIAPDMKEGKGNTTSKISSSRRKRGSRLNNLDHKRHKSSSDMSRANRNRWESGSSQGSSGSTEGMTDTRGASEEVDITSGSLGHSAPTTDATADISKDTQEVSRERDVTRETPAPTAESVKEIGVTPEPSPESITTSKPSESTANPTEPTSEIVAIPAPSEENMTTSESKEKTAGITEPTSEIVATPAPSEGNVIASEPKEKTADVTEPPAETVVSVSQLGEETTTNCNPSDETATTTVLRKGTPVNDAESSEVLPPTSDLIEDEAAFPEPAHKPTATSEPAEETTATSEPAEETTATSEPADKSTAISEPAEETTAISEPAEETTATSEPADEFTTTNEPAEESTATSKPADESTATSELAEETTATYARVEETATTYSATEDTTASSAPVEETTVTSAPVEETTVTSAPVEETTATFTPVEETTATFTPVEETTATFTPVEETTATFTPVEETTATFTPVEETTATFTPVEETTATSTPVEETTATSTPVEETTATSTPVEETTATSTPVEETTATSTPVEETTATSTPVEETTATSTPVEETTATSTPVEETTATSTPVEETTATSTPVEETTATSTPVEETTATSTPVEETTATSTPVEETTATFTPVEETTATSTPVEETTATSTPVEETTATSTPVEETTATSTPVEETTATSTPVEETTATSTPVEETTVASAPVEEITATFAPVEETTATSTLAEETTVTVAPAKETSVTSTPAEETTVTSTPAEETTVTSTPAEETTVTSTPAEETTVTSTPAEETTVTSTPAEETTVTSTPTEETTVTSTPAEETTVTSTPAEETTVTSTPAEDTRTSAEESSRVGIGFARQSPSSVVSAEEVAGITETPESSAVEPPEATAATTEPAQQTVEPPGDRVATPEPAQQTVSSIQQAKGPGITESSKEIPVCGNILEAETIPEPSESMMTTTGLCRAPSASSELSRDTQVTVEESPAILGASGQDRVTTEPSESPVTTPHKDAEVAAREIPIILAPLGQDNTVRKPYKTIVTSEKEQARKGRFSSPSTKADKSSPGRTPGKPRTPHGPPEKKQKLSFEELMNYDIRGIEPS